MRSCFTCGILLNYFLVASYVDDNVMNQNYVPRHIAVIPDGNRRWGKAHGFIPHEGMRVGAEKFRAVSETLFQAGVACVSFWTASEDNFRKRSPAELAFLISLGKSFLRDKAFQSMLDEHSVRFRTLGYWWESVKDSELLDLINTTEERTKNNVKFNLTSLFGYDGRREMREAVEKLSNDGQKKIVDEDIKSRLLTRDLPSVDLVIRTGGEPHWSAGFMMWEVSDAQLYFTEILWPDFGSEEALTALRDYSARERRYGK